MTSGMKLARNKEGRFAERSAGYTVLPGKVTEGWGVDGHWYGFRGEEGTLLVTIRPYYLSMER